MAAHHQEGRGEGLPFQDLDVPSRQVFGRVGDDIDLLVQEILRRVGGAECDGFEIGPLGEIVVCPFQPYTDDIQPRTAQPVSELEGACAGWLLEETAALALDEVAGKDLAEIHTQEIEGGDIGALPLDLESVFVTDLEPDDLRSLATPVFLGADHLAGQALVISAFGFLMDQSL